MILAALDELSSEITRGQFHILERLTTFFEQLQPR